MEYRRRQCDDGAGRARPTAPYSPRQRGAVLMVAALAVLAAACGSDSSITVYIPVTRTPSVVPTPSAAPPTATSTTVPTRTATAPPTATTPPEATATHTATRVPTRTASTTATATAVPATATATASATAQPPTATASRTLTPIPPSATATATLTAPPTASATATVTRTAVATATNTAAVPPTATATASFTATGIPTGTATATFTATAIPTGTAAATATVTASPTLTATAPPTATFTATALPSATFTATATPTGGSGAVCGNRVLEMGETCTSCPADCVVGPCNSPGAPTQAFIVDLIQPSGFQPTSATVELGYNSTVLNIPGTGTATTVRQRVVAPPPVPQAFTPNDKDYALVVQETRLTPLGQLYTVTFDRCAGAPVPTLADVSCTVMSCAQSGAPVTGCRCAARLP